VAAIGRHRAAAAQGGRGRGGGDRDLRRSRVRRAAAVVPAGGGGCTFPSSGSNASLRFTRPGSTTIQDFARAAMLLTATGTGRSPSLGTVLAPAASAGAWTVAADHLHLPDRLALPWLLSVRVLSRMLFSMIDDGSSGGDGKQAGWYTLGGAVSTAGVTIWSVGFAKSPPSQELEFLGLIAFIAGLAIVIFAMPKRRAKLKSKRVPAGSSAHRRYLSALNSRLVLILIVSTALVVIAVGGIVISSGQDLPPAGMTLEITPDHGGISATINVFGTGCPQGDQIDIYFDGKALFPSPKCQANHAYQYSYSPDQNGTLTWVDGSGSSKRFTLSPDRTYYVYAQTVPGGPVSPRVTYRVG
jgi:hypothetical protein